MKFFNLLKNSTCFTVLALSGCMLPSSTMINQAMAMRGTLVGTGGIAGNDAEEFSKKLVTLKPGVATKEDCISLLGKPAMRSEYNLMYHLNNTGAQGPVVAQLFFRNGILSKVDVTKVGVNDGTVDANNVYSKGKTNIGF